MKKNLFYSILVLLFIFTGCSQNQVEVDTAEGTVNTENMEQSSAEQSVVDADSTVDKVEGVEETVVEDSGMVADATDGAFEPVLFEFDKFSLTPEMLTVARNNAAKVISSNIASIKLEGNCDEFGSDEYNYALGLKRAKTIKDILVAEGYDAANISTVSFGESNPVCTEKTDACWAKNRRVEFK